MEFESYTLVVLIRPDTAPDLPEHELDLIQERHVAFNRAMRERGVMAAPPAPSAINPIQPGVACACTAPARMRRWRWRRPTRLFGPEGSNRTSSRGWCRKAS